MDCSWRKSLCGGGVDEPLDVGAGDQLGGIAFGLAWTFEHGGDYNGERLTIIYSAPLAGTLKGTVEVQPFGATGTFTAALAPAAEPKKP